MGQAGCSSRSSSCEAPESDDNSGEPTETSHISSSALNKSNLFFSKWGTQSPSGYNSDLFTNGRGTGMVIIGDINQDGYEDLAVGAPFSGIAPLTMERRVDVFSGHDRSLLFSIHGGTAYLKFGYQLAAAGGVLVLRFLQQK